ncbi:MAG: tryptophan--tRNA ligase, partial [Oscillospiraceae bacterium]|nr:tryptophan--tRNA ligase [Oscillospiraceae bacterium]
RSAHRLHLRLARREGEELRYARRPASWHEALSLGPLPRHGRDRALARGKAEAALPRRVLAPGPVEDKSKKNADNINGGLFAYPSRKAADIQHNQPDYVPLGQDQKQHVELCRNIVQRFNGIYGEVFKMPEFLSTKAGARVMCLTQPESKMSKSLPEGCVFLMEKPDDIRRKFKRAVTDSDTERCVRFDAEAKPGVSNLMSIYSAITGKSYDEIEREFDGLGYGAFKPAVGDAVVELLTPIREETERLLKDKAYLESVYKAGAEKAGWVAEKTLRKVYKKVGFLQR